MLNPLREALRSWGHYAHSLGYDRYYGFICPHVRTSLLSAFPVTGSLPFGLPLRIGFSCSLKEPEQRSCHLYAVRCIALIRYFATLCLSGSLPPRFYRSKGYLRHLDNGSLSFNSSAHTIQSLDLRMSDFALTLTLSTTPWKCSTSRRFDKSACTAFTDRPIVMHILHATQPVSSLDLRNCICVTYVAIPIISFKVMLPLQRTFHIFVSCGNAGHTTCGNRLLLSLGLMMQMQNFYYI